MPQPDRELSSQRLCYMTVMIIKNRKIYILVTLGRQTFFFVMQWNHCQYQFADDEPLSNRPLCLKSTISTQDTIVRSFVQYLKEIRISILLFRLSRFRNNIEISSRCSCAFLTGESRILLNHIHGHRMLDYSNYLQQPIRRVIFFSTN